MNAIFIKAWADLRRRRLQAAVIFLTVLLAVGTGMMALTLMTQTSDPYRTAFAAQKGAHLQVYYDGATSRQALAATPSLIGASSFYKMDYRFATDPSAAQLAGYVAQLRAGLPAGSVAGATNFLLIASIFNITNQILTSVLVAFSVFALAATAAIVANLVTGIVVSSYREIGIMKAIGFAPRDVVAVLVLQIQAPTLLACLIGIPVGAVAIGMPRSFQKINDSETSAGNMQVIVTRNDGFPDSDVMRILTAQPETTRVVGLSGVNIDVPGISNPVNTRVFRGDSWHLGYLLVAGRWFDGPGEVLAEKALLRDAHLSIVDTFTGMANGRPLRLRVVGEVYDVSNLGHELFTDWSTYAELSPASSPGVDYLPPTPR